MSVRERLHRSELAVPASNERALEKAPGLGADLVFLDLEDAVAPDDKETARENAIAALLDLDWSGCSVSVRINGLDTHWCYRDVVEVMERAGERLDTLLIPKVGSPSDVEFVATLCSQIEQARGIAPVNMHILIETASGMANVEAIARAVPERLEAMVFGVADYAASVQARTTNIGGPTRTTMLTDPSAETGARAFHWGDQWHFGISRMVAACRAEGLRPIDGPYGDIADAEGYVAAARRAAALGCEGKWAIHPSQVPIANEVHAERAESSGPPDRGRMEQPRRRARARIADGQLPASIRWREPAAKVDQMREVEDVRGA
jgi:malyl-CoA/(S)-citramalyl-CoA lyase